MANKIKLKQSSVSGKVPTTTDLDLGELGINTYDGKLFLKQKVGAVETIIDVTGAASGVTSVSGSAPIVSSGGVNPSISISAATTLAAGSMSAADKTKIDAVTGTNTGDESATSIRTKLSITTLSGSNTGDQTLPVASSTTPAALGVAAVGVGTTFARADHVHLIPTLATLGAQAAGSYLTVGGALGTPSSGTLTNCTFPTLNQNTTGSSASCTGNAATATTCNGNYNTTNAQQNGTDGWWRSTGAAGWFNSTYAVGIWATEGGNVRTYNGANFIAAGTISGTNITTGGNVTGSSTSCTGNAATVTQHPNRTDAAWYQVNWNNGSAGDNNLYSSGNVLLRSSEYGAIGWNGSAWYIEGNASYGLYSNTGFYAAGGLWDAGNRVYSAINPQVNISGNAATATSLTTKVGSAPSYACRAWVNFNGTGTVAIRGSGNVSSITDNSAGDYTVNFTTAMPDATYSAVANCNGVATTSIAPHMFGSGQGIASYAASSVKIQLEHGGVSPADREVVTVAIFR